MVGFVYDAALVQAYGDGGDFWGAYYWPVGPGIVAFSIGMTALLAGLVLWRCSTSPDRSQGLGWAAAWLGWVGASLYGIGFTTEVFSPGFMNQTGYVLALMMTASFPVMIAAAVFGIVGAVRAIWVRSS